MNHEKPDPQLEARSLHDEIMAKRLSGPQNLQSYVNLLYTNTGQTTAFYDNDY